MSHKFPSISVAALYVHRKGPYPELVSDWYDEHRDARSYAGSLPVVAHPPCGPWGRYAHRCKQDKSLALHALDVVRSVGGVLEHPSTSRLWAELDPIEYHGGPRYKLIEIEQYQWLHRAIKPTKLFVCCKNPWMMPVIEQYLKRPPFPDSQRPDGGRHSSQLEKLSKFQRCLTPRPLAEALVTVAAMCAPCEADMLEKLTEVKA